MHFAMNEAWVLEGGEPPDLIAELEGPIVSHREVYPDGKTRATWSIRTTRSGRVLLEGTETWFYRDGRPQWEAHYHAGRKIGTETCWSPAGRKVWMWEHRPDGSAVWTQWWANGHKKAESTWKDRRCDGIATVSSPTGHIVSRSHFVAGKLVE